MIKGKTASAIFRFSLGVEIEYYFERSKACLLRNLFANYTSFWYYCIEICDASISEKQSYNWRMIGYKRNNECADMFVFLFSFHVKQ